MVKVFMATCLLPVALAVGETTDVGARRLSTDWLTPPLEVGHQSADVRCVELVMAQLDDDGGTGMMTLYRGEPTYNLFGDAQKNTLQKQELRIFLNANVEVDSAAPRLGPRSARDERAEGQLRSLYQLSSDAVPIDRLQLVWSKTEDHESRLLVKKDGQVRFARILPLRPAGLSEQAKRYPESNPADLQLKSDLFLGKKDRFTYITFFGRHPEILFSQDPNHYNFNRFGDIVESTDMASPNRKVKLQELQVPDPTGEGRRLFRCDVESVEAQLPPPALVRRVSVPFVQDVTHERAAGYGTFQEAVFEQLPGASPCPPNRHRLRFRYTEVGHPGSNRPSCT